MQRTTVLYLLFTTTLAAIAWQMHRRQARQMEEYADTWQTIGRVNQVLNNICEGHSNRISKGADAFPSPHNRQLRRQAQSCRQQMEALAEQTGAISQPLQHRWERYPNIQDFATFPPYSAESLVQHSKAVHTFFDSLFWFSAKDSLATAALSTLETFMPALRRPDQAKLWMAVKQVEYNTAGLSALSGLDRRLNRHQYRADRCLPIIYSESHCTPAGKAFEAYVFAAGYFSDNTLKMSINDEPIPVAGGIGLWRQVYKTPGDRTVTVKVQLRNPLTGNISILMRQFSIPVCP